MRKIALPVGPTAALLIFASSGWAGVLSPPVSNAECTAGPGPVDGNLGDIVPLLITTNPASNASSFGHAYGFAEAVVHTGFGNAFVVVCTNGTCGTSLTSFSGTFSTQGFWGESGDYIQVEVEAASGDSLVSEFASASADPLIEIDPNFAGAGNYSIVLAPGVGNGIGAVPEPASGLLVSAAIALGLLRKRRSAA